MFSVPCQLLMNFWTLPRREIKENSLHSKVATHPSQMRSVVKLPLQMVKLLRLILMTTMTKWARWSHINISLICASSSKLDACNMVILNFHLIYLHNFESFALTYNAKNYLVPNKHL